MIESLGWWLLIPNYLIGYACMVFLEVFLNEEWPNSSYLKPKDRRVLKLGTLYAPFVLFHGMWGHLMLAILSMIWAIFHLCQAVNGFRRNGFRPKWIPDGNTVLWAAKPIPQSEPESHPYAFTDVPDESHER